jgi:nucleotide-binding universal stress UspA family protein
MFALAGVLLKKESLMRIVCAVDGSEYARWGVQALQALAGREPEQVVLLHVVDPSLLKANKRKNPVAANRALAALDKAGKFLLREAERSARVALSQAGTGPRTQFQTVLAHGPMAKTIGTQAKRLKADLILMGSRGLSDIKGFLLGSTSRQVAAVAPCSLLVVKRPLTRLRQVALAVDDSKPSRAAARFLRTRILPESATVSILTSAESPVTDLASRYLSVTQLAALTQPVMDRATSLVNTLRDDFIKDGFPAVPHVRMNHVIDTIVKHVEAEHDDLLVFGSRELSKTERLYLGSVSETLLRHAPCSVLIVRGARV